MKHVEDELAVLLAEPRLAVRGQVKWVPGLALGSAHQVGDAAVYLGLRLRAAGAADVGDERAQLRESDAGRPAR